MKHWTTFLVEPVLELVRAGEPYAMAEGKKVSLHKSRRLKTFASKGTACVECGLQADRFELQKGYADKYWHLALMAGEVRMTKDHIRPSSKGGTDALENLQPMCEPCNQLKSDSEEMVQELIEAAHTYVERRTGQRRKSRVGLCRRCGGTRHVPTGEPDECLISGDIGTPMKPCSCMENQ